MLEQEDYKEMYGEVFYRLDTLPVRHFNPIFRFMDWQTLYRYRIKSSCWECLLVAVSFAEREEVEIAKDFEWNGPIVQFIVVLLPAGW